MSANLDLVRSIVSVWERAEYGNETRWAHPELEWAFVDGPAPGTGIGFEGLAEAWSDWLDTWDTLGVEAEEYRDLDGGRVLVLFQMTVRGKTSGAEARAAGASVFTLRDGKVASLAHYADRRLALARLGLEE